MYFNIGRLPAILTGCVLVTGLAPGCVTAAEYPLTLAEAELLALDAEPGREELLAYAKALGREADAAVKLPDPILRVGLANYPIDGSGFSAEPMTQAQLGFRQEFPRRSIREASADRYRALSSVRRLGADTRQLDTLERARSAWLEVYLWQRTEELLQESRSVFADLIDVTRSLYAEGRRTQHDVIRAQLELSRLDDRLIGAAESKAAAQAQLSEWLGPDAFRVVAPSLPSWSAVPPIEVLRQGLQSHPGLAAADSAIAAGDAGVTSAREHRKAGWALDVGYGYRDGLAADGTRRSDMVTINVVVDLPFFGRERQDHKLAAALGDRSAAQSARQRILANLQSRLHGEYARWNELTRRLELFEKTILPLAGDQADAALRAYGSDAGDFADVTRSYVDALDTRIDYIRIQVARAQRYAALDALGGLSQ